MFMSDTHIQIDVVETEPLQRDAMIIVRQPGNNKRDLWVLVESASEYTDGGGSSRIVNGAVERINRLFASGKKLPVFIDDTILSERNL
jgi:hypothetical protein